MPYELWIDWGEVITPPPGSLENFPDCPMTQVHIADQPGWDTATAKITFNHLPFKGRRNRILAAFSRYLYRTEEHHAHWFTTSFASEPRRKPAFVRDHRMTFREAFEALMGDSEPAEQARAWLSSQPLRKTKVDQIFETPGQMRNERGADLHRYLHDLALMIRRDLREAIDAAEQGGYYPGVDEGIDPVPDTLVEAVILGVQRELDRELRQSPNGGGALPAYPLAERMPLSIQRAFAERRRLRFKEWGIGRDEWERNSWSVFSVPDDNWLPPWEA